jgi:hypothetical protein
MSDTFDARRRRGAWVDGLIVGATQAVVLILLLVVLTFAFGNQQQVAAQYQRAIACELSIPSDPHTGRDPGDVAKCFIDAGLEPPPVATP